MKIALAGNPNSGKTTMYNALTGCNEKIGNWAGVTVEKKEHSIKKIYYNDIEQLIAVDLPGAYSMSPFTSEESVTRDYIKNESPDVIINIVDSTNLSRSLFFTTQLLELGIPMVVALNKTDLNTKKENEINVNKLSQLLNCSVVQTTSITSDGLKKLIEVAVSLYGKKQDAPFNQMNIDFNSKESVERADRLRYKFVNDVVSKVEIRKVYTKDFNKQDKVDSFLTNRWLGIPIFAIVMFLVFQISQSWIGPFFADILVGWLEIIQEWIRELLSNESGQLSIWSSMLVDGIIGGVIAVVGFLPLVMVMYFLIAILEDCGYMARVSVVLDPIFKKVGLSGKSVIPFVIGTGCAIPGVMACRTIRNEKEKRATAMLAPFMPCGAKLPVIALFVGVFFPEASWLGTVMYFIGIAIILVGALLVKLLTGVRHKKSYFIIELPEYKIPNFWKACLSMLDRGWAYIVKAGTIILVCNFVVHVMQTFDWSFNVVDAEQSILHDIATPFAYILAPIIGVVAWQLAAAAVTGFIAKENIVGTIAVCYGITNFISVEDLELMGGASEVATIIGITRIAGLAFLMFNLFSPPCFAAIGAMNSEMKSKKWLFAGLGLQFAMGYSVAFLTFFIGSLLSGTYLGENWMIIVGWLIIAFIVLIILVLIIKNNKKNNSLLKGN